jgi:hypothetical protein
MDDPIKDTTGRIEGYTYEAFKNDLSARPTRLLRLFPAASFDEEITCKLFHTTLDAKNRVTLKPSPTHGATQTSLHPSHFMASYTISRRI